MKMVDFGISGWSCTMYSIETNSTTNSTLSRCNQYWGCYLVRMNNITYSNEFNMRERERERKRGR
jgi:hypothetical protein